MHKTVVAIISITAFVAGLLIGGVGAVVYLGNFVGEALVSYKQLQFVESGEEAFNAYRNQDPWVAIYALRRHLNELEKTENLTKEGTGLVSQKDIDFDRMITHGRLAKLHQAEGNEEKASEHVAKAISFADGIGLQIKDKDGVMERVESTDRHDESDQRRHKSRVSM